jgi:uncharacterized protein DUF2800
MYGLRLPALERTAISAQESEVAMSDDPRRGMTSASNAACDLLCPGRHLAQRGLPEVKGQWSETGTAIHAALATGDASKLSLAEHETYEACRIIGDRLVADYFGPKVTPTVFREQRMWSRFKVKFQTKEGEKVGELSHSGQVDAAFRSGTKALVLDYKSLSNEAPESPKNLQLRDLAVLVRGSLMAVSEVAVAIVQPLVTHSPQITLYTREDLVRAEAEMQRRIIASNDPKSPRIAGEFQCKFCLAKNQCREYSAWAGALLPTQNIVEGILVQDIFRTAMQEWTPEQRANVASILAPAAKVLKEMEEFLKDGLAKDQEFVPGWTLKDGSKRETIADPQACFERFVQIVLAQTTWEQGQATKSFMQAVKIGKTRLKQQLSEATGKKGKALEEALRGLLDGITESSQNAPSLARKDDN